VCVCVCVCVREREREGEEVHRERRSRAQAWRRWSQSFPGPPRICELLGISYWGAGNHPGGNPGANRKSLSHGCYLREVAFEWELTNETIYLPLGCLQHGADGPNRAQDRRVSAISFRFNNESRICHKFSVQQPRICHKFSIQQHSVLDSTTASSQKCEAVPRRAHIVGSATSTLGLTVTKKKKKKSGISCWASGKIVVNLSRIELVGRQ